MPLWVSFCGLGLLAAAAGYVLIDRGSDEAEVKVNKAMSPLVNTFRNPCVGMAVAILGGIALQRLLRGRRQVVVERSVEAVPTAPPDNGENRTAAEAAGRPRTIGFRTFSANSCVRSGQLPRKQRLLSACRQWESPRSANWSPSCSGPTTRKVKMSNDTRAVPRGLNNRTRAHADPPDPPTTDSITRSSVRMCDR